VAAPDLVPAVVERVERVERLALKFPEVAALLGCSRQHVYAEVARGRLPAVQIGKRCRRILRTDLDDYLARCRAAA
jgi:excisionase family DNA binding protein